MKYLLSLLLVCHVTHTHALPPCEPSWLPVAAVPLLVYDAPVLPNVLLPLTPTNHFGGPPDYDSLMVAVHDGEGATVAGHVLPAFVVAEDVATPAWVPDAALMPGVTYTLTYSAAAFYDCGVPLEGALSITVAHDPRPVPTLAGSATFVDTTYSGSAGLTRSCGPGAIACEGRPGICCARADPQTVRYVEFDLRATFDPTMSLYYRVTATPTSAALGTSVHRMIFSGTEILTGPVFELPFDDAPPAADDGCFELVFEDLMLGATLSTQSLCAEGLRVVDDTSCESNCRFNLDPLDPTPPESAEVEVSGAARDEGCGGGATSLLGLIVCGLRSLRSRAAATRSLGGYR